MKKIKKIVAIFMVFIILLSPVYATTTNSAKNMYIKAVKTTFADYLKLIKNSEIYKLSEFSAKESNSESDSLSIEVKIPDVKTRRYIISDNTLKKEEYEDAHIKALVEEEEVANIDCVVNGSKFSLRIPELFDIYFTQDLAKLDELYEKWEIENKSKVDSYKYSSELKKEVNDILTFTKQEKMIIEKASKKYSKLVENELLKSEYFSTVNKENIKIDNLSYNCDTATYTISNIDLLKSINNIWKEFKNDTEFSNLVWSKAEKIYELMRERDSSLKSLTKEQAMGAVDTWFSDVFEKMTSRVDFTLKIYFQNNKILRTDLKMATYWDNDYSYAYDMGTFYTVYNNNQKYFAYVNEDNSIKFEDKIVEKTNEITHNFIITEKKIKYEYPDEYWYSDEYVAPTKKETENVFTIKLKILKISSDEYDFEIFNEVSEQMPTVYKLNGKYKRNKLASKECDFDLSLWTEVQNKKYELNFEYNSKKDATIKKIDTKKNEKILSDMAKDEFINFFKDNEETIKEKIEGKFGLAFYYDEIKKATDSINDRMQVRANTATAAQIGKAARVWYVEMKTDPYYIKQLNSSNNLSSYSWKKMSDLYNFDWYIDTNLKPQNGDYYVAIISKNGMDKIVVAIAENEFDLPMPYEVEEVNYNGNVGVVYIET